MFEFLKSWSGKPEINISILELHELLNTPISFRKDFRQFRTRVLEKAHKDITTHTSFRYEWEPVKAGRSVEAIRFCLLRTKGLDRSNTAESQRRKAAPVADTKGDPGSGLRQGERRKLSDDGQQAHSLQGMSANGTL